MKVQIFEQFKGGHCTNYIQYLLPTLVKLIDEKVIDEIVVTLTPDHFTSEPFHQQLASYSERVHFDPYLPEVHQNLSLDPNLIMRQPGQIASAMQRRAEIASNLINAVHRVKPDYLISTTADPQSMTLATNAFLGRETLTKAIHSVGIIHYGYSGAAVNVIDQMKDFVYRSVWKYSPWSRLLVVNPLVYESLSARGNLLAKRIGLVPDPVPPSMYFDKKTARNLLKIPTDGRYIGFVGTIDHRMAIPELVAAFRDATLSSTDRLLLAGRILPQYKKLIENEFTELLDCERVILLDQYLDVDELMAGFCALDIASILYYKKPNLSANLLKALAAQRPVIANNFGYTGMIVRRFDVGWSCDVLNHRDLVETLTRGLEESLSYRFNEKVTRLIQFHHPENYAETVLMDLWNIVTPGYATQVKTWEWVLNSDSPDPS